MINRVRERRLRSEEVSRCRDSALYGDVRGTPTQPSNGEAMKVRVRKVVECALRSGAIVRPNVCEYPGCANSRLEAHHEDYARPLEVKWLCKGHHVEADGRRRCRQMRTRKTP